VSSQGRGTLEIDLALSRFFRRQGASERTAAKLLRNGGTSVKDISQFLDHSSLAVTTTHLRRLESQDHRGREPVALAIELRLL
jgi:integrase